MSDALTIRVPVTGMTCAACQARVQRTLQQQVGVADASVNLMMHDATIRFDPNVTAPDRLVAAIRDAGYGAEVADDKQSALEEQDIRDGLAASEFRELRAKAWGSGAAGVLAMVLSMPLMSQHAAGSTTKSGAMIEHAIRGDAASGLASGGTVADPFMHWAMQLLEPALRATVPMLYRIPAMWLSWLLLAMTVMIMAWAGRHFYVRAWAALRHGATDMNTLISIGTIAAFAYSVVATVAPSVFASRGVAPDVYYESVIIIIAFVLIGNALEARAKSRTSSAVRALAQLQPKLARVMRDDREFELPVDQLLTGDVVLVRPFERVPVDGVVVAGDSSVDESLVTGESMPVPKRSDDRVIGGSTNGAGAFRLRVTTLGADSVLTQIVTLMRDAQGSRAPIQALADRIAAVFVPIVLALTVVTFVAWYVLADSAPMARAFAAAVSVLIIACPCAMGLAVPTAVMVATGRGAQLGLLIKGGDVLQRAGDITTVVLDKTGTITEGKPTVTEIRSVRNAHGEPRFHAEELLMRAAAIESLSEHPLARAIVDEGKRRLGAIPSPTSFQSLVGRGAMGLVDDESVLIGNAALMAEHGIDTTVLAASAEAMDRLGRTSVYVAIQGELAGIIAVSDRVKPNARAAVDALRGLGLTVVMVSGDNPRTARAVADQVGIDRVVASALPADKVREIRTLQAAHGVVAMIGDGVNDAPALAQADVGIAMGAGSDIAIDAGDIVLVRGDLHNAVSAIMLSRRTMRVIKQNLAWAFLYNVVALPIAAGVLFPAFGLLLSPVLASAAMSLSSVSVVSNSLRLRSA